MQIHEAAGGSEVERVEGGRVRAFERAHARGHEERREATTGADRLEDRSGEDPGLEPEASLLSRRSRGISSGSEQYGG